MLLPDARELIKKFDETLFNIRDMNIYHRGMVTLACIPTAVFYFLPLAIGKFNELYPNIKVRILEQGTNNCMESVLCNESDFGINMNNITNSSIDFTPLVNEPFVLACRRDHPLAKKQLVEWQELVGYKMIGVRSSSGNRLLIEQKLSDKPWKLDWFYEVRHLSTSLGLVEAGLGISALPGLAMPHAPYSSIIGIPLVEPVIRRTLGIIRRKDAVLSPAAERFFALLINLWTDDKDNLWTNIVERQRHALQEMGEYPGAGNTAPGNSTVSVRSPPPTSAPARPHSDLFHAVAPARRQFRKLRCGEIFARRQSDTCHCDQR